MKVTKEVKRTLKHMLSGLVEKMPENVSELTLSQSISGVNCTSAFKLEWVKQ